MPRATGLDVRPGGAICDLCGLAHRPFVGSDPPRDGRPADIALVGEAPGATEAATGLPFTGKAGRLLDRALQEAGIDRGRCLVTNAVLCWPEGNATPDRQDVAYCRGRLIRELRESGAKVAVLLGGTAATALLGPCSEVATTKPEKRAVLASLGLRTEPRIEKQVKVGEVRGMPLRLEGLDLRAVVTWHPAAVLRNPSLYRDLVNDLKLARNLLEGGEREHPWLGIWLAGDEDSLREMARRASEAGRSGRTVVVDVETDRAGLPIVLGVALWDEEAVQVWLAPRQYLVPLHPALKEALDGLAVSGHDVKYDCQVLWRIGAAVLPGDDSMLLHYLVDERTGTHSLESVVRQLYSDHPDLARWASFKKERGRLEELPFEDVAWYNAMDTYFTLRAIRDLKAALDEGGRRVYERLLQPAQLPLAYMERRGVLIDRVALEALGEELDGRLADLEGRMRACLERAGCGHAALAANPKSPLKMAWVLYDLLGLPDPSGERSTAVEYLREIEGQHEFVGLLLEYRRLQKLKSTYVDTIWKRLGEAPDGRLRGRFNLHGTTTGRLSSSSPNLQNIPKHKGEEARLVRDIFVATPGHTLVEADLSQAELRVLAYFSRDPNLLAAIASGADLHRATAARVFGVPEDQVTQNLRSVAKTLNFAVLYGAGPGRVAETILKTTGIRLSEREAQQVIDQWFAAFPRVREWIDAVKSEALRTGQVRTPLGRVRRWPVVDEDDLREAVNFPIQSVAADITLLSLIRLFRELPPADHLLLTVHDSILLETSRDPQECARQVRDAMLRVADEVVEGVVPFEVEVSAGQRWGSLEVLDLSGALTSTAGQGVVA